MKTTWLALVAAAVLAGCGPAPHTSEGTATNIAELELGRKVWNFRCYYCHGYSGDAKTLATSFVSPPPRDFTAPEAAHLTREQMIQAIRDGRPGTAMAAFSRTLSAREIAAVADFVRDEFISKKAVNTRYHTAVAGWPNHDRYRAAFPFATGDIPLDTPEEKLDPAQLAGRQLFMTSCVSCHDRAKVTADPVQWELRAISYPPNVDACTGCHKYSVDLHPGTKAPHPEYAYPRIAPSEQVSPYALHDKAPQIADMTAQERLGEKLFQRNCTFCHAADGTGKNWIGAFLEPHPRDLTDTRFMSNVTRAKLVTSIREGLPETSMPAWKHVLKEHEVSAIVAYIARAFHPVAQ